MPATQPNVTAWPAWLHQILRPPQRSGMAEAALDRRAGHAALRQLLASPGTTSDMLLATADQTEQLEAIAAELDNFDAAEHLHDLAQLLRLLAPVYADVPLPGPGA